jgi:hypothetical protein
MKWNDVTLHVEYLLPGIFIFALLGLSPATIIAEAHILQTDQWKETWFAVILVVGTAYTLGIGASALGRVALDGFSRLGARALIMRALRSADFEEWTLRDVDSGYRDTVGSALSEKDNPLRSEVEKRREHTRLFRSTLVPAWMVTNGLVIQSLWFSALVVFVVYLLLYVFSEIAIYDEARLFRSAPTQHK